MLKKISSILIICLFLMQIVTQNVSSEFFEKWNNNHEFFEAKEITNSHEERNFLSFSNTAFIKNIGQLNNKDILFYIQNMGLWFSRDGILIDVAKNKPRNNDSLIIKQRYIGINNINPEGRILLSYRSNFFYGNDPSEWQTNVPNYKEIYYQNIYDQIDLKYYIINNNLKYDIIVNPGANLEQIKIRYEGINKLKLNDDKNLIIKTNLIDLNDGSLFIYQDQLGIKKQVSGRFKLFNNYEYGFEILGEYDHTKPLIIDPLIFLEFSTYFGGSYDDYGSGVGIDSNNNVYMTGYTESSDLPTSQDANDTSHNGDYDCFILKLNPSGTDLLYSTFIGGSSEDYSIDIDVDGIGNSYITGRTYSSNFPTTAGANDTSYNGAFDCFVVKLNSKGSNLIFSTYIGGTGDEKGDGIKIDSNGNSYISGYSKSSDFPTTSGAYDTSYNGAGDIISFKLNPSGSALVYSTYIGGTAGDLAHDISIDSLGNAYVVGWSYSSDFPKSSGVYDPSHNGETDCVIFKLNQSGNKLDYSTFLGGTKWDYGYGIDIDNSGCAYVAGYTLSSNFPTTTGAMNMSFNGGSTDAFIVKFYNNGSNITYSTYLGGNGNDYGRDLKVDSKGNAYVTGYTDSPDFHTSQNAFDKSIIENDGFIFKLNQNGTNSIYSSYIGGSDGDESYSICLDSAGNAFVTGMTYSTDFPNTTGAYNNISNGGADAYALKVSFQSFIKISSLAILENDNETNLIYSKYCPYTFKVEVFNTKTISDLDYLELILDPTGEKLKLYWNKALNQFSEINDPNDYITLDPSSNSITNPPYSSTVFFNVTFNWKYPNEDFNDIHIHSTSKTMSPVWFNTTNRYKIENDLILNGTIFVKGEDNRIITNNSLVRGGEELNWTGLKTIYENSSNIYPPEEEFDVTIWDCSGNSWSDSPALGENFSIETITESNTDLIGEKYKINITGIPPECDGTDEALTIKIDGDNVKFSNFTPNNETWQVTSDITVGVDISDIGGANVNSSSVKYSLSMDNGDTWSDYIKIQESVPSETIVVSELITLDDGDDNFIKWQAMDTLGNGPSVSIANRILVDTKNVVFFSGFPGLIDISTTNKVEVGITISDITSGVDATTIEYSTSYDRGKTWNDWLSLNEFSNDSKIDVKINLSFPNGTDNMLKWRVSDIAGNGPEESEPFMININTWKEKIKPKTILLTPLNGITIKNTSVELIWELEDSTMKNIVYDIYFDNITSPKIFKENITNRSFIVNDLKDGETYYWRVIPNTNNSKGVCTSGLWWFIVEIPKDEKLYKISITGIKSISIYQGENESIILTISNLGTEKDRIKLNINSEKLSNYISLSDSSPLELQSKSYGHRDMLIKTSYDTQPGFYELIVTAISIGSGEKVKENHIISIEIKEKKTNGPNGPNTNGPLDNNTTSDPKDNKNDLILYSVIIIIVIIVVLIVSFLILKRKKEKKILPIDSVTTKPIPTHIINIGDGPNNSESPQISSLTSNTPAISKDFSSADRTTHRILKSPIVGLPPQKMSETVQTPQLPPAQAQQEDSNVKEISKTPTVATPQPTLASTPVAPTIKGSKQENSTQQSSQTNNSVLRTEQGPTVHLPDSTQKNE